MRGIQLSDDVYRRLLGQAESFEDTPEDVIVRLLAHADTETTRPPVSTRSAQTGRRASPGSILPEAAYWKPILAVIEESGGRMPANDVIEAVGERLRDQMTPRDFEPQKLGEMRWRNRVRFARLRMKERGLLSATSPRGIWEITDEGRRHLAE